ncbi:ABC transporter substrate-binding protein [Bacillus sp. B-jedd]|uniref:ABC transporter substrate-binding protein n=1 Tax=Bacillus sp. B-jedd TaxID=1476857 RepID=UPI0005156904|nr:ABC transporter substrate-binding protein [Bacillus sp. B-jedd]CEG25945.1 putative glycerol-3-phosphate ABC transporter glycerol-3-phosphate-binding protein [Bacillus sp. B-jedd]
MRKIILVGISLMLLVFAAVGCSQKSSSGSGTKKGEKVELTWYFPIAVGGPLTKIIEKLAEDFTKENPDIVIKPVYTGTYDETMTKVQTAIQGKTSPDLAVLLSTELYTLLDMKAITPLDEFFTGSASNKADSFYPAFMENSQTGGKTYSLPFQRSTIVLYYNKDAFEKAGLDKKQPPKNWDELVEYGKKLVDSGMKAGVEIPSTNFQYWMFQALALQNGKNLMSDDGKEVYFDTPENEEALQFMMDLAQKHKISPNGVIDWATAPSDFLEGNTAMLYHTTGNLTNIKNNAKFDFGVAFLPAGKNYGSPTGGGNFYIFNDIPKEKKEAAWKFIDWATQPERAAQWSIDTGYVATSKAAYETDEMKKYVESFPQAVVARDQLEHASAELSTHSNGKIYKIINDNIQAAITGKASAKEALKKAQEDAEKVLKPYNK